MTDNDLIKKIKQLALTQNLCITKRNYNGLWCLTTVKNMSEDENFAIALQNLYEKEFVNDR